MVCVHNWVSECVFTTTKLYQHNGTCNIDNDDNGNSSRRSSCLFVATVRSKLIIEGFLWLYLLSTPIWTWQSNGCTGKNEQEKKEKKRNIHSGITIIKIAQTTTYVKMCNNNHAQQTVDSHNNAVDLFIFHFIAIFWNWSEKSGVRYAILIDMMRYRIWHGKFNKRTHTHMYERMRDEKTSFLDLFWYLFHKSIAITTKTTTTTTTKKNTETKMMTQSDGATR